MPITYPAYLVFHDAYLKGEMDVFPCESLALAERLAESRNDEMDALGGEGCGRWAAYVQLPHLRVFAYHPPVSR